MGLMEFQAPNAYQRWLESPLDIHTRQSVEVSSTQSISFCVSKPKSTQEGPSLNIGTLGHISEVTQEHSKHPLLTSQTRRFDDVWEKMEQCGELPFIEDMMLILHECQESKRGKCTSRAHLFMVKHGLETETMLGNFLVPMFVACGGLTFAKQLFQKSAHRTERAWTSLIQGYIKAGEWRCAFGMFEDMQEDGVQPSRFTYMALLRCCATLAHVTRGHSLHSKIVREGHEEDIFIGNALVDMYGRFGVLADAQELFSKLPSRDVVSWNSLISGYAEQGLIGEALLSLERMQFEGMLPDNVTFVCILKACIGLRALDKGQKLHSEIVKKGCEKDSSIVKSLVDLYSLCRLLADARMIITLLPVKDHHAWTTLMAAYADHGSSSEVLECKEQMHLEGLSSNTTVLVHGLKACGSLKSIVCGRAVHSEVVKLGFQGCPIVTSALITMYIKCDSLAEAWLVFDGMLVRDAIAWTVMITGFVEHGYAEEALDYFQQMQMEGVFLDDVAFVSALQACGTIGAIDRGRETHAEIAKEGLETSSFIGSTLMHMYAECGCLKEVRDVFEELPVKDLVLWNTLIGAYIKCGVYDEALRCLEQLKEREIPPDAATFVCCLKACSYRRAINKGKEIHSQLVKQGLERDIYMSSTLLDMYCKCGSLSEAQNVFDVLPVRNVVAWSALISGYVENNDSAEALKCLEQMQLEHVCPDTVTVVCNLKACGSIGAINKGLEVHSYIVKAGHACDTLLGSSLVDFYLKFGLLAEGQHVFKKLPLRDVISWTALIAGYIDLGLPKNALNCYHQMQVEGVSPNAVTLVCVLKACGSMGAIETGLETHTEVVKEALESDLCVSNTLIDMYAKCALLEEAFEVFDELCLIRDVVSWSAILTGCVEQVETNKALELYAQMQDQGVVPNDVILSSILRVCGDVAALETGKRLHAQIFQGCEGEVMLATAVLDMYGKCGSIVDAQQLFDSLHGKDIVALNALFNGYARCGESNLLFCCFEKIKTMRIAPNDITYLSLLTMCSHGGLIGEGQKYFHAMSEKDGILPNAKHYDCLVDLLGRAGQLEEAAALLGNTPFELDIIAWINMMGACRRLGNLELGSQAFECAEKLDELGPAIFVLMSDIYAASEVGEWRPGDWG